MTWKRLALLVAATLILIVLGLWLDMPRAVEMPLTLLALLLIVPPLTDAWVRRMRALSSPGSRPPKPPQGS